MNLPRFRRSRRWASLSQAAVLAVACTLPWQAQAQPQAQSQAAERYPDRAVRIVVPSSPGGSLDAVARLLAQELGEAWKQPVVVDNRPGASFAIGTAAVAQAPGDGYTLLYAHDGALAMNPVLYPKLPYDPQRDLRPVGRVVDLPLVLYAGPSVPFQSMAEFVQAVKGNPGRYNHASGGTATMMTSELFKAVAGLDYVDIPYKGGGPAVLAVAGGEADFTFADPGSAMPMLQSGRIRALGTASPQRLRLQPELPTIAETVPAYATASWSGLHAPAGTPDAVIERIHGALRAVLAKPETQQRLDQLGVEVHPSSPEELKGQIASDIAKWRKVVAEQNLTLP